MSHSSQSEPELQPQSQVGEYVVESLLGEGAAAKVYRAHLATANGRGDHPEMVALKVLKRAAMSQPAVLACFQFEARVLSRLEHPGILRVYKAGMDDERLYTAMELVEGSSLDKYLLAMKRFTEPVAVNIARQAAEALGFLHGHGYVHRDVKPANLMVTPAGRAILFDFGTVIRRNDSISYEVGLYGTPAFLAPEQIRGDGRIDGRADLYALGMILYLMVTGRKPFYGSRSETLDAHLHQTPPSPSEFAHVSPMLEAIILRALAKDPADRFQSGEEFAAALCAATLIPQPVKQNIVTRLFGWLRPKTASKSKQ